MTNKKTLYADIALLVVALIWGSGFVVTRNALDYASPFYIMSLRFTLAFLVLGLIYFKRFIGQSRNSFKAGIIIGIFLFLGFATQTVGLQYTSAGNQAFITGTNVVMVPFFYWFISKKEPDKYDLIGAILCFIGIAILSLDHNLRIGYGDFLTFLCAIAFALHITAIGHYSKKYDPIVLTINQFLLVSILSIISYIIVGESNTSLPRQAYFSILYLGIFSTLIAFLVQNIAQKYTTSTHTAIILSLEAVSGGLMALIFLKESFTIKFLIGCIAIFIAIITSETKWTFIRNLNKKKEV